MYPHRIRLRGPWECEPLARFVVRADGTRALQQEDLPPKRRMLLPCRWGEGGLPDFAGRVRFRRRFGYPGQIDAHERVWLTFGAVTGVADIRLNGRLLGQHDGTAGPFEHEVTNLLQARNELAVEIEAGAEGGLWGEVAMEVRASAFLRGTRVWATRRGETACLYVAGEIVGTCERPLELYVLLDRSTVHYSTLEAEPGGRSFCVSSEELDPERWRRAGSEPPAVRVELVNGASVWYALEQPLELQPGEPGT